MGSETTMKLPVIDFTNLKQETQAWETVKTRVKEALEEYGCFEAVFDRVPLRLRKSLFDVLIQLFDIPFENKLRNKSSDKPYHGHLIVRQQGEEVPSYESLAINDALSPGAVENFTNLMWSQGNPDFRKTMQSYIEQLSQLDKTVRRMVVEGLGLGKYMDEHIDSNEYLVRVQKYNNVSQAHETETVFPSHTDENTLTILYQNEVNGLEVQTKDGQWITVEPSPGSFVVLIGGAFHAWTNGRLHVPYHRVMMRAGDQARYSIALFSSPKPGHVIQAPEEMVDEENPLLFKPFEFTEYLDFAFNFEAGPATISALKDFCGV